MAHTHPCAWICIGALDPQYNSQISNQDVSVGLISQTVAICPKLSKLGCNLIAPWQCQHSILYKADLVELYQLSRLPIHDNEAFIIAMPTQPTRKFSQQGKCFLANLNAFNNWHWRPKITVEANLQNWEFNNWKYSMASSLYVGWQEVTLEKRL